jgi:hypothetical protein
MLYISGRIGKTSDSLSTLLEPYLPLQHTAPYFRAFARFLGITIFSEQYSDLSPRSQVVFGQYM